MASVDRLLEALAAKLPSDASRSTVEFALRAAIDALPQSKTRDRLLARQAGYIRRLLGLVQEKRVEATPDSADDKKEADADTGEADEGLEAALAAYEGVDSDNTAACLRRCKELLTKALASIKPENRAEEALSGLLSLLPPESQADAWEADVACLKTLAQLLPSAVAAMAVVGTEDPNLVWCRFSGLVAGCHMRVQELPSSEEKEVRELARRLGSALTLLACPAAARSALRISLSLLDSVSTTILLRTAYLLPLVRVAFGERFAPLGNDLTALLSTLRFLCIARRLDLDASSAVGLSEARNIVLESLGRDFDASPLLPELNRLAEAHATKMRSGKALKRKLSACAQGVRSPSAAASVTVELLEAIAQRLQQSDVSRLVAYSGLKVAKEEAIDTKAAAARARGDLFFEDVGGSSTGLIERSAVVAEVAAEAHKRALGSIDGVEALQDSGPAEESPGRGKAKASPITSPKTSPKTGGTAEQPSAKRVRRRTKSSA